jgi:small subunit ribosomal protein S2
MAKEEMLTELDSYLSAGIHIGTKFKTGFMKKYVYKTRPDGLAVLNIQKVDERLGSAAKFMSEFEPESILVVCRRETGIASAKKFAEVLGTHVITGRYLPGAMTNPEYGDRFIQPKLLFVADPWPDKIAINDALKIGIPVVAMCDTNNVTTNVDLVIPCNNKGKKSIAMVYWVLAKEIMKAKKRKFDLKAEDFE